MATYYGRAGSQNWNVAGAWSNTSGGASNGAVPDATTDCVLDASSGSMTIDGTSGTPSLCRSLVCTGYTGTLTHASAKWLVVGDGTTGHFTLVSGMTYSPSAFSVLKFVSTTTGNNITFGGKTLGPTTFDGVGGEWTFQDQARFGSTATNNCTLTNGSIVTNNQTVSGAFSSSNSNTRSLTLGTTTWTLGGQTGLMWDISTSTNMTLSAASSTITINAVGNACTFAGGGLTYGTVQNTGLTTALCTITGANTYATLTLSQGANAGTTTSGYELSANQTVTGTFTANGNSVVNRAYIRSSVRGTARTITAATVSCTHLDLEDITGAGAGSWDLSAITGNSGDCGGNSGITFTTPTTVYWVPSGGTSTGSESVTTRWATSSGGTAGTGRSPLPQDTAVFDASSIDAGSRTITQDKPRIGAHNWTGVTNTPAWAKTTAAFFYGSITMVAGMTNSGNPVYTYRGAGSSTLTGNSGSFTNALTVDCGAGTLTQGSNIASNNAFIMSSGTFAGASTYTTSFTSAACNGGTVTLTGNMTLTTTFTVSGGTFGNGTGVVTGGTTATFNGGTTNIAGFSGSGLVTAGDGTVTFGASGAISSAAGFTKSGSGNCTINGASSFAGVMSISGTGALTINADVTGTSIWSTTGANIAINDARVTYNNGYIEGAGAGGGAVTTAYAFCG